MLNVSKERNSSILLFAIGCAIYLPNLGSFALRQWDEGHWALAAKAIVAEGDWLVPQIYLFRDGLVPMLLKPPLSIWMQAVSMELFGVTTFAARLPIALTTVVLAVFVYRIAREWFGWRAAFPSALIFLVSPAVYLPGHSGRSASMEIPLILFGFAFVWLVWTRPESKRAMVLAGVAAGLAVLTKGVGAGVFLFMLLPCVLANPRAYLTRKALAGALVGLATMLPWFLLAWLRYPDLVVHNFVARQLQRSAGGLNSYGNPIIPTANYPYLSLFTTNVKYIPIGLLLVGSVVALFVINRKLSTRDKTVLWWAISPLAFYGLLGGNQPWYILPMVVPTAILAGRTIALVVESSEDWLDASKNVDFELPSVAYVVLAVVVTATLIGAVGVVLPPSGATNQHDAAMELNAAAGDGSVFVDREVRPIPYSFTFYLDDRPEPVTIGEINDQDGTMHALVSTDNVDTIERPVEELVRGESMMAVRVG